MTDGLLRSGEAWPRDDSLDLCGAVAEVALAVKDLRDGLKDQMISLESMQAGRADEALRLLSNASTRLNSAGESADRALDRVVSIFRKFGEDA